MKNNDIKIGQHCWAIANCFGADRLLVVIKISDENYDVCGAWECGMLANELKIIKIIERPDNHKNTSLYYYGSSIKEKK